VVGPGVEVDAHGEVSEAVHRLHLGAETRPEAQHVARAAQRLAALEAAHEVRIVLVAGLVEAVLDVVELGGLVLEVLLVGAVLAPRELALALPQLRVEARLACRGLVGALARARLVADAVAQDVAYPLDDLADHGCLAEWAP